jgi:hypothetical protein
LSSQARPTPCARWETRDDGSRQLPAQVTPADGGTVHTVPVADLRPAKSPRLHGVDTGHTQLLAESEAVLPPILVHRESMRVIDGMHRLCVAVLRNQPTIEVRFFDGDADEAFVAAVQANIRHGMPLTLADREAAAARIIVAFPERSDSWIAAITGLAARTVRGIRQRAEASIPEVTARVGRDGRVRPLNSADARRAASEAIAQDPDASLRHIARLTGISPATVRDVRERMRRGEDPVPAGQRGRSSRPERPPPNGGPEPGTTAPAPTTGRDHASLLGSLSRDPSLRFTEFGRNLLRWLYERTRGPRDAGDLLDRVPPHCAYLVAEVARGCADEWLEFAAQLERRLRSMD